MTREEAIKVIDNVKFQFQSSIDEVDIDEDCREAYEDNKEVVEALDMSIKSLKQEPINDVLDKIRTEIENDWQLKKYPSSPFSCGLRRALEIVDKYKSESEVENAE